MSDWENAQLIRTFCERSGPVSAIAFSSDGEVLAIGSCDSAVKLWQMKTGDRGRTLFGYPLGVNCVAMNPRSPLLAVGIPDGTVELWQLTDGKQFRRFTGEGRVTAVTFNPNGTLLICGTDNSFMDTMFATPSLDEDQTTPNVQGGTIQIWDIDDARAFETLYVPNAPVNAIAVSPSGKFFASGHRDNTIKLWHLGDLEPIATLSDHDDAVYSVAIGPDGNILASGSGDGTIKLWKIDDFTQFPQQPVSTLSSHADVVYCVAIAPDGRTLASGSGDGTIKLWEIATGTLKATLNGDSHLPQEATISVAFSPDNQTLAAGMGDGAIKIWGRLS